METRTEQRSAEKSRFEQECINTVRILAADAVQKAKSGHPGTPMALAPLGHVLWTRIMNYNPVNVKWPNRDRFVLSAGHACMLQYSFLFLTGYKLTLEDIRQFRQLHSITAGHPEYRLLEGIETTTGPLGQGFGNAVGMAIASQSLAARFNRPGFELFNYTVYCICSDGDMMEGISHEAASLAGHLQLSNLICLYDDNRISIEGKTEITFTEDVVKRFEAYGWFVQEVNDGNDTEAIAHALEQAKKENQRPSLIKIRTHIAYGSPNKMDTKEAHGAPLGEEEVKLVKKNFGFDPEKQFYIPENVLNFYRRMREEGIQKEKIWNRLFNIYAYQHPDLAEEYLRFANGKLPKDWEKQIPEFKAGEKMATRKASGKVLNAIAGSLPQLIGGSADLVPSTDTNLEKFSSFSAQDRIGRNLHFGVREHAMGAILNGISLSPGMIAYGATFLIFSDYLKPPIRLACIMRLHPVFIFTHDSIGLGEDGTTHQPVEQLIALRAIPRMTVIRPADANETAQAWRIAIEQQSEGPVALVLTRQDLPVLEKTKHSPSTDLRNGAYILAESEKDPSLILIATGSEVHLALEAKEILEKEGIPIRVVSMPSWELFRKTDRAYQEKILPPQLKKRLSIEAGSVFGWAEFVTDEGSSIGLRDFGMSAPGEKLMKEFGFTAENIVEKSKQLLAQSST